LRREARFQVKMAKHTMFGPLLDDQASFFVASPMEHAPSQISVKNVGFIAVSDTAEEGLLFGALDFWFL